MSCERTPEVDKDDIIRIHDKQDETNKNVSELAVQVAKLATAVENMPKLKQPCEWLERHLQEHKDNTRDWKRYIIGGLVGVAFATIVGMFMFFLNHNGISVK